MKPSEKDPVVERLLERLEPPLPPPELRARVLAAAGSRAAVERVSDVWTKIWENRMLRWAWAASVLALIAGHLILVPQHSSPQMVIADVFGDDEMAEFMRPDRIDETAIPNLGRSIGDGRELVANEHGGDAS